jgi:hypothetical protein
VREVFHQYCDQVVIKVIDAALVEGFFKSLRYRVHKYPAVIVDRRKRFVGGALQEANVEIARILRADHLSVVTPIMKQEGGPIEEI